MFKRIITFFLILTIVLSWTATSLAAAQTTQDQKTTALKDLGIASGIPSFDLTKNLTKVDAVVMYLRLLGKDSEAKISTYKNPFKDVPTWASKYIAYANSKGLASGTSKTTFGSNYAVTSEQFLTFMLKALGYNDNANGDFNSKTVIQKAEKLGIIPSAKYKAGAKLTRGNSVEIIYSVLGANKKDGKATLAKSLVDGKAIDAAKAEKYGFYKSTPALTPTPTPAPTTPPTSTPAPTYQTVRIPLQKVQDSGTTHWAIWPDDVLKAVPGAKYTDFGWSRNIKLDDYVGAYNFDVAKGILNGVPSENGGGQYVDYYTRYAGGNNGRSVITVYDEKANMLAVGVAIARDAIANGFIDFVLLSVNGEDLIAKQNADFEKVFGNPAECKDAIIRIEKAKVNFTFISRKTGKVVSTGLASTNGIPDTYYRYVIDNTKYPELTANTKYLGEYSLSSGMTAVDSLKQVSLIWFKSGNYNGTLGGELLVTDFTMGNNGWTKRAMEWNNTLCLSFADANKKLIGCTSFVPSLLKVVDVGTVDQTAYVN